MKCSSLKSYLLLLLFYFAGIITVIGQDNPSKPQGTIINKKVPGAPQKIKGGGSPNQVNFTFIQLNDVYEIAPVQDGKYGGIARVGTVIRRNKQVEPNTFAFLSGDFLSPSAVGLALDENGIPIKGKQMVAALNAAGVNYVTFGNHEFDIKEDELQQRINESKFEWISSNVSHLVNGTAVPFVKEKDKNVVPFARSRILTISNRSDNKVNIGLIALTLPANQQPWVYYDDFIAAAQAAYDSIKEKADFVMAITHLTLEEDKMLARAIPQLRLIMGGHEHENILIKYGDTYVSKADANAITVYVHHMRYNVLTHELLMQPAILEIDSTITPDSSVSRVVDYWMNTANKSFAKLGFDPDKIVTTTSEIFDGFEHDIRFMQTNLGELVSHSMIAASNMKVDAALLNSGSIRIDDQLTGEITQYDILRVLPFGGQIWVVEMKGSLLKKVLDVASANLGSGGYIQYSGITMNGASKKWTVGGTELDETKTYVIAVNDFLVSGKESRLDFFTVNNPEIIHVTYPDPKNKGDLRNDLRKALIDYMGKNVR